MRYDLHCRRFIHVLLLGPLLWLLGCRPPLCILIGTVRDAQDLKMIADAQVTIAARILFTGSDGRFETPIAPGTYQVTISAPHYASESFTLAIDRRTLRHEREVLLMRRTLRGTVISDRSAQPIDGARVVHDQTVTTSDVTGCFELVVSPGAPLQVSSPGYVPVEVPYVALQSAFDPTGVQVVPFVVSLSPRTLTGTVIDAETGRPISGVLVSLAHRSVRTDASGHYELVCFEPVGSLSFAHEAYRPLSGVAYHGQAIQDARLEPWRVRIRAVDRVSSEVLPRVTVQGGEIEAQTNADGYVSLRLKPGAPLTLTLEGYDTTTLTYEGQGELEVALQPSRIVGLVRDRFTGKPLPEALVQVYSEGPVPILLRTDMDGRFVIEDGSAVRGLAVKVPGYRRLAMPITQTGRLDLALEPFEARGIYIPFGLLTVPKVITELLTLVETSELNAVVVDVKSDRARLAWPSEVPLAQELRAYQADVMDLREFLRACQTRGIYTIARMVIFKDDLLARKRPEWAVKRADGQMYLDLEGLAWADPFRQEVHDYCIALALEVAAMGFDEIQFDYVRFPSDGQTKGLLYNQESTFESRTRALAEFCAQARKALDLTPAFFSADVFGLTPLVEPSSDMGIGQRIEDIAPHVDYISPMAYPATYISGNLGLDDPLVHPYEVVYGTVSKLRERTKTKVRPWLQAYSWRGVIYGPVELFKQRRGAEDAQSCGWLYWNAAGRYRAEAFKPGAYEEFSRTFAPPAAKGEVPLSPLFHITSWP